MNSQSFCLPYCPSDASSWIIIYNKLNVISEAKKREAIFLSFGDDGEILFKSNSTFDDDDVCSIENIYSREGEEYEMDGDLEGEFLETLG